MRASAARPPTIPSKSSTPSAGGSANDIKTQQGISAARDADIQGILKVNPTVLAMVGQSGSTDPAAVTQAINTLQALARQSLGPLGTGVRWFAFEGSMIHSCTPGKLSVPFAGETYTYDTPIPGCPK